MNSHIWANWMWLRRTRGKVQTASEPQAAGSSGAEMGVTLLLFFGLRLRRVLSKIG